MTNATLSTWSTKKKPFAAVWMLALLFLWGGSTSHAYAQSADQIRTEAQRILSAPEFRHFDHLTTRTGRGTPADSPSSSEPTHSEPTASGPAGAPAKGSPARGAKQPDNSGTDNAGQTRTAGDATQRPTRPDRQSQTAPSPTKRRKHDNSRNSNSPARQSAPAQPESTGNVLPDGLSAMFAPLGSAVGFVMQGLAYLIIGAICLAIVWLVIRSLLSNWKGDPAQMITPPLASTPNTADAGTPPGATPADQFALLAESLARAGQFREAMAQLILGTMSHLERSGWIEYQQGLTARDYLRSIRRQTEAQRGFRQLLGEYEPVGYGRRRATAVAFEQARAGYRTVLGQLPPREGR